MPKLTLRCRRRDQSFLPYGCRRRPFGIVSAFIFRISCGHGEVPALAFTHELVLGCIFPYPANGVEREVVPPAWQSTPRKRCLGRTRDLLFAAGGRRGGAPGRWRAAAGALERGLTYVAIAHAEEVLAFTQPTLNGFASRIQRLRDKMLRGHDKQLIAPCLFPRGATTRVRPRLSRLANSDLHRLAANLAAEDTPLGGRVPPQEAVGR